MRISSAPIASAASISLCRAPTSCAQRAVAHNSLPSAAIRRRVTASVAVSNLSVVAEPALQIRAMRLRARGAMRRTLGLASLRHAARLAAETEKGMVFSVYDYITKVCQKM